MIDLYITENDVKYEYGDYEGYQLTSHEENPISIGSVRMIMHNLFYAKSCWRESSFERKSFLYFFEKEIYIPGLYKIDWKLVSLEEYRSSSDIDKKLRDRMLKDLRDQIMQRL